MSEDDTKPDDKGDLEKTPHNWEGVKKYHRTTKQGVPYGLNERHFFQFIRRAGVVGEISPALRDKFTDEDLLAFGFSNEMLSQAVFRKEKYATDVNVPEQLRKDIRNDKARVERDYGEKDKVRRHQRMEIFLADERERAFVLPIEDASDLKVFVYGTPTEKVTEFNKYYEKNKKSILKYAGRLGAKLSKRTPSEQRQIVMIMFLELVGNIYLEAQGVLDATG